MNKEARHGNEGCNIVLTTTALQAYKEPSKDCRGLFLAASQARDQNERESDDMMTRMMKLDAPKINDLDGKDVARACLYSAANPAIAKYIQRPAACCMWHQMIQIPAFE